MYKYRCTKCEAVITGEDVASVVDAASEHMEAKHGVEVDDKLRAAIMGLTIKARAQ